MSLLLSSHILAALWEMYRTIKNQTCSSEHNQTHHMLKQNSLNHNAQLVAGGYSNQNGLHVQHQNTLYNM